MPKGDGLKRCWADPQWRASRVSGIKSPAVSQHRIACLLRSAKFRSEMAARKEKAEIDRKHLRSELNRMTKQHDDLLSALCQIYIVDRQNKFVAGKLDPSAMTKAEFMLRERIQALESRCEEMETEMGLAPESLDPFDILRDFGLYKQQRVLISALMRREYLTHVQINFALGLSEDESGNLSKVIISQARKRLKPYSVTIENIWGVGYKIPPESKAKLRALIAPQRAAAE